LRGFYEPAYETVITRNNTPSVWKIGKALPPPLSSFLPAIGLDAFLDRKSDFKLGFL
jgi:hypothetical protein